MVKFSFRASWIAIALSALAVSAGQNQWTGTAGDKLWSSPSNWSLNAAPLESDTVIFNSTSLDTIKLDANATIASLRFESSNTVTLDLANFKMHTLTLEGKGGGLLCGSDTLFVHGNTNLNEMTRFDARQGTVAIIADTSSFKAYIFQGKHEFNNLILWSKPGKKKGSPAVYPSAETLKVKGDLTLAWNRAPSGSNSIVGFDKNNPVVKVGGSFNSFLLGANAGGNSQWSDLGKGTFIVKGNVNIASGIRTNDLTKIILIGDSVQNFSYSGGFRGIVEHRGMGVFKPAPGEVIGEVMQSDGSLDVSGKKLTISRNLTINQGSKTALIGLSKSMLTVNGKASFIGNDSVKISLKADTLWTLAAHGLLVARNAEIKSCSTLVTVGVAFNSADSGANSGWIFNPPAGTIIIALQPKELNSKAGLSAKLTVGALGTDSLMVNWFKVGDSVSLASGNSLAFTSLTYADSGSKYYAKLSDSGGAMAISDTVLVSVVDPPVIAKGLSDVKGVEGDTVKFTVTATGLDLTFQWYKGNLSTPINQETTATLTLNGVSLADNGVKYYVIVSGKHSPTQSASANLTVYKRDQPLILAQPIADTVSLEAGADSAKFSVSASSTYKMSYQWFVDEKAISKATDSNFTYPVSGKQPGTVMRVYVRISNEASLVTFSDTVDLVIYDPSISSLPRRAGYFTEQVSYAEGVLYFTKSAEVRFISSNGRQIWSRKGKAGNWLIVPENLQQGIRQGSIHLQIQ